jgi:Fe-S-cluster containining protein
VLTDLVQIRTLGEKKRPENERFRRHLKRHDHSDRILRRIGEKIEDEIDCTACANCCRVATVRVTERDVERISKELGMPREQFLSEHTVQDEADGLILARGPNGCTFLQGNLCSIYDVRPDHCSRFPHLVRGPGSIVSRMWEFADRACYCPIIYNALEAFKTETGFQR